ncbi:MAG: hypothetical protein QXM68_01360 [Candidatus Aenigmatarchaeota archaeon]|nr:hypothetical protein [Candidatus Aenigmarchaeota archaeon]
MKFSSYVLLALILLPSLVYAFSFTGLVTSLKEFFSSISNPGIPSTTYITDNEIVPAQASSSLGIIPCSSGSQCNIKCYWPETAFCTCNDPAGSHCVCATCDSQRCGNPGAISTCCYYASVCTGPDPNCGDSAKTCPAGTRLCNSGGISYEKECFAAGCGNKYYIKWNCCPVTTTRTTTPPTTTSTTTPTPTTTTVKVCQSYIDIKCEIFGGRPKLNVTFNWFTMNHPSVYSYVTLYRFEGVRFGNEPGMPESSTDAQSGEVTYRYISIRNWGPLYTSPNKFEHIDNVLIYPYIYKAEGRVFNSTSFIEGCLSDKIVQCSIPTTTTTTKTTTRTTTPPITTTPNTTRTTTPPITTTPNTTRTTTPPITTTPNTTRTTTPTTTTTTLPCSIDINAECSCPDYTTKTLYPFTAFMYDCNSNYQVRCNDDNGRNIKQILTACSGSVSVNTDVYCTNKYGTRALYIAWNLVNNYEYLDNIEFNYLYESSIMSKFLIQIYSKGRWVYLCDERGEGMDGPGGAPGRLCSKGPFNLTDYWYGSNIGIARILFIKLPEGDSIGYEFYDEAHSPKESDYYICATGSQTSVNPGIELQCHSYPKCALLKMSYCPSFEVSGIVYWNYLQGSSSNVYITKDQNLVWQTSIPGLYSCGNWPYCGYFETENLDIKDNSVYSVLGQVVYDGNAINGCYDKTDVLCKIATPTPTTPTATSTTPTRTTTKTTTFTTRTTTKTTTPTTTTVKVCSYTPGGWGLDKCPTSCRDTTNPGCIRDCNWIKVFGNGNFVVGKNSTQGGYTVTFTNSSYVASFLPSVVPGNPSCLIKSSVNPSNREELGTGQFIDNLIATKLNVLYSDKGITPYGLGDQVIQQGRFAGMKVRDFVLHAEEVLSCRNQNGCCYDQSYIEEVSETARFINEKYECTYTTTNANILDRIVETFNSIFRR